MPKKKKTKSRTKKKGLKKTKSRTKKKGLKKTKSRTKKKGLKKIVEKELLFKTKPEWVKSV